MSKIQKIYSLSFIFSLHLAISAYINSTFLSEFVGEKFVGILYTTASIITLILLSKISDILEKMGNRKSIVIFLILNMFSLMGLILSPSTIVVAISFILFSITNTLTFFCLDIFIEHFSDPTKTGKTRGLYLTILNTAYMISPLIAAFVITKGGYRLVYILAFLMVSIMTLGLVFSIKTFKDKAYKKLPFMETLKGLKNNKNIASIVLINFLLQFFFAWMVVYTPIYLHEHIGFDWDKIGVIFTIMLAPFVILGLPIGILIDKYNFNKRKFLRIGFAITIIFTIAISFLTSNNIVIWAFILFMTRIGASIIETNSEIYFFSNTDDEDAYLIGLYRDMNPVAYIIAPILATIIFFILPIKYLFVVLGIIMMIAFYLIPKLKYENKISNTNK